MKYAVLFLALLCLAGASTPINPAGSTTVQTAVSQSITDTTPAYYFYWDMNQLRPNFGLSLPQFNATIGASSNTYNEEMQLSAGASLDANPSDSNNLWLHIDNSDFEVSWAFNNSNNNEWGKALGKGYIQMDWMYSGTYVDLALLIQLNGKANTGSVYDSPEGRALRTSITGGSSSPGIDGITFVSPAAGDKYRLIYRWNAITSNPDSLRTSIRYVIQNNGTQRKSGYSTSTFSQPKAAAWHHILPGNDTVNNFENWIKDLYIGGDWGFDLPVNLWQDFEFATLDTTNLQARDHNGTAAWQLLGTTTRFTTSTNGQKTMPCSVNLWLDSGGVDAAGYSNTAGTLGLRDDLSATAAGSIGNTFSDITTGVSYGFWFKGPTLTASTSRQVVFNSQQSAVHKILAMRYRNVAGVYTVLLSNEDNTDSSAITVSPDTWYWAAVYGQRNSTCRLRIYGEDMVQVGSEVTVSAVSSRSIGSIRIGSLTTSTAQTAGTYMYVDNLIYDNSETRYPLLPWE